MQIRCNWKCEGFKLQANRRMREVEEGIMDNDLKQGRDHLTLPDEKAKVAFPVCVGMVLISVI